MGLSFSFEVGGGGGGGGGGPLLSIARISVDVSNPLLSFDLILVVRVFCSPGGGVPDVIDRSAQSGADQVCGGQGKFERPEQKQRR